MVMKGASEKRYIYKLFGRSVCRQAFMRCFDISNNRLHRLQKWLQHGYTQPPQDLRHTSTKKRSRAREGCDGALQWAYDVLAECYNSSDVRPADIEVDAIAPQLTDDKEQFLALPTLDGYREWVYGPGATVTATAAEARIVKWLPPMGLIDLYQTCQEQMNSKPSYSTFTRVYNESWCHCLRFRSSIQQSKCDRCERFKLLRKQATTPERAEAVRAEHLEHIKSTFLDRAVDERMQKAACEATTAPGGVPLTRSILNMDIDGMEAHKFKCPRNLPGAKMLANLWRPQQNMVGAIVDGCGDQYWLVPPDVVKNANLSATLTADVLQQTSALLRERGVPMPRTFRVHSDNAGGEVKNQTFMKFMAFLAHNHFNSTEMTQFRPGHSHGRIDQAFNVIGTALNKPNRVLQTPDDFQRCMEATQGSRKVRVTQLGAVYDWESFFEPLQVAPHSHVQSHAMSLQNKEACHVFRFYRRDAQIPGGLGEQMPVHTIFEDPPADDDIILVTKHLLGSESYTQEPIVFCPGARLRALATAGPKAIPGRVEFSPLQKKEFRKTAERVKMSPFNMHRASEWLTNLLRANLNRLSPTWLAPDISWIVSDAQQSLQQTPMTRALPSATPVPVVMEDVSRRRLKRKQADRLAPLRNLEELSAALAPAAQRIRAQNFVQPSAAQSVAGAPLLAVNEAGAPANVAAPRATLRDTMATRIRTADEMSTRMRNRLKSIPMQPSLGLSLIHI